jgi:hypothetical protein
MGLEKLFFIIAVNLEDLAFFTFPLNVKQLFAVSRGEFPARSLPALVGRTLRTNVF